MISLAHIAVLVDDLDRMVEFYEHIFRMRTVWRSGEKAYLTTGANDIFALLRKPGFRVKSFDLGRVAERPDETPNFFHFGAVVSSQSEFDELLDRARSAGVEVYGPKTSRDTTCSFYFHDPAGYAVQVVYPPSEYFSRRAS